MEKHVIVTGGSRGLGLEMARHLLQHGYLVTTVSRGLTDELRELQRESGEALQPIQADLSDLDSLPELARRAAARAPLYGLVNNAAVAPEGLLVTAAAKEVEQVIAVNLTSVILLSRAVARQLVRRRGGRIVNISSIVAARAFSGLVAYSSTKAGLEAMTRTLARELGPRGVTVNAVAPGFIDTDMSSTLTAGQKERIRRRTPLGETATGRDVAAVVRFLLSEDARMLTGAVITVDGGFSL